MHAFVTIKVLVLKINENNATTTTNDLPGEIRHPLQLMTTSGDFFSS